MFLRCFTCDARFGNEPTLYSCRKCDNPLEVVYEDAEFARATAFEDDLPSLGIKVVDEGCGRIDDDEDAVRDYSSVLTRV